MSQILQEDVIALALKGNNYGLDCKSGFFVMIREQDKIPFGKEMIEFIPFLVCVFQSIRRGYRIFPYFSGWIVLSQLAYVFMAISF